MKTTLAASALSRWRVFLLGLGVGLCGLAFAWFLIQRPRFGLLLAICVIALLLGVVLFFRRDGTLSFRWVPVPLLVIAILFPYIRLPDPIPDVRLELIIVLTAWGLLLLGQIATGHPIRLRWYKTYKWFLLIGLSILLSMTYAALGKGQPVIWRDFWELAKLLQYFLTFTLVAVLRISPVDMKRYYKFALVTLFLSALFGFLQYVDVAGVNQILSPYYAPTQMRGLLLHGRITGTARNPNEFGALMVLAASLALAGALFFRERRLRILCWAILPVFWLALFLTLSRSSLVALFVAGVTVLFLFLRQKGLNRRFRRMVTLVIFSCVLGVILLIMAPEKALFRFSQLGAFTEASSWQARVENWRTHFAIWTESPWLGWGPGKATMGTIVDNEWLLVLRRYGVVGLAIFLGLFGSLFLGLSRIRRGSSEPAVVALTIALQGTFAGYGLYMALASVYHSLQLMSIFLLLLGLAYSQWRPVRTVQEMPKS